MLYTLLIQNVKFISSLSRSREAKMLTSSLLPLKPYTVSPCTRLANRPLIKKRPISLSVRNVPDGSEKSIETSLDSNSDPIPVNGSEEMQKMQVVVKVMEKSRLVLKFIWMEKNIGLALDQVVPGYGTVPITPYYFWPMEDAWEELKLKLEKPWISKKRTVTLLNQATDLINLWQQSVVES